MPRNRMTAAQFAACVEARAKPMKSGKSRKPAVLVAPSWAVEFVVPCVVVSESNQREAHWAVRYRRFKLQQSAMEAVTRAAPVVVADVDPGTVVTFTRLGGKAMDSDNLAGSCKAIRDAVARWLGRDDGDKALTFYYRQEPDNGPQGIRVRVEGKL